MAKSNRMESSDWQIGIIQKNGIKGVRIEIETLGNLNNLKNVRIETLAIGPTTFSARASGERYLPTPLATMGSYSTPTSWLPENVQVNP